MRVLIIDRMPPVSLRQGNALIGRHLFRRLGHHELVLVSPVLAGERAEVEEALRPVFDRVYLVETPAIPSALGGWLDAAVPWIPGRAGAPAIGEVLSHLARDRVFDVVHVRQLPMAPYGSRVRANGRLLELIDSETLATRRDPRPGLRLAVRRHVAREVERRAMRGFDVVTAVASPDADVLASLAPRHTRVEVVPNGVDTVVFAPLLEPEVPDSIVFLGAMSFPPNVAAVEWFTAEVLPLVLAQRPGATFRIVGRDPVPAVVALGARPGVVVTGEVDDVRPSLGRAAVAVCPMISGSGIKNKALEALAMGRAVVATPLAVDGLEAVPGRDLEVAATPSGMADAIVRLLADPGARAMLGRSGRRLVQETYSWEAAAGRYECLYRQLAGGGGPGGEREATGVAAGVRR